MIENLDIENEVPKGGKKHFDLHIARLPTGTIVNVSVNIYRGKKDGPTLLLSGGLHGDEVNGVEIIRRMMEDNSIQPIAGTVIAIPVLNIYGFLNFARDLPDGKDANRSFPGTKNGSLASRVAFHVKSKILPLIDYGIDFHTGGGNRSNYPQVRCEFNDKNTFELAEAFGAPFIVNSSLIANSLRNEAKAMNKCMIVYEGGEALRFDENAILEGIAGTQRVMQHLGMIRKRTVHKKKHDSVILSKTSWLRAENSGLFHSEVALGSEIKQNQYIGHITDPYNQYRYDVHSPTDGYIIGLNYSPVLHAGDALVHIGIPGSAAPNQNADSQHTSEAEAAK